MATLSIRADLGGRGSKHFSVKKGVFSEKGGGNSVNEGFGKDFYRKGNSVKLSSSPSQTSALIPQWTNSRPLSVVGWPRCCSSESPNNHSRPLYKSYFCFTVIISPPRRTVRCDPKITWYHTNCRKILPKTFVLSWACNAWKWMTPTASR